MNKIKFDLNDRTAVITGGAQGFGLDIAKRFLDSGAKVIIWDIDPKLIDEASKEINNQNLSLSIVDISDYKAVETAVTNILKNSKIDILINNAGITGPTMPLWEYDIEMWNKIIKINLSGTFNCCRAIVPSMIKNNYGRIVNVASVAGIDGNQSYASRRNMEMANSLIIDPEELNDDDDSFIPNGSSISNINGDINDKKAMLEAQRKELTESIIEGL